MASLSFATTAIIMIIIAGNSAVAGDLRPSDHGLIFQNSPPAPANSTEMRSFFNSSPTSTSSDVSLPKATNSTESLPPSWGRASGGGHWGGALMVASLVGGITGVILLLASALLYLKHRRNPTSNDSFRHNDNNNNNNNNDNNDNNANKLYLVPAVSNL